MSDLIVPKRKAIAISNGIFLVCLAILFYTNFWWPGILLALWVTLGTRQYLSGRKFDLGVTTVLLVGLFIVSLLDINIDMLIPILLVLGGIYIIFREYFFSEDTNGEEKSEEIKEDADVE